MTTLLNHYIIWAICMLAEHQPIDNTNKVAKDLRLWCKDLEIGYNLSCNHTMIQVKKKDIRMDLRPLRLWGVPQATLRYSHQCYPIQLDIYIIDRLNIFSKKEGGGDFMRFFWSFFNWHDEPRWWGDPKRLENKNPRYFSVLTTLWPISPHLFPAHLWKKPESNLIFLSSPWLVMVDIWTKFAINGAINRRGRFRDWKSTAVK